jgi:hypothetical protein
MKKIIINISLVFTLMLISDSGFSQNYSEQAKVYFSKYLDSKSYFDLCINSLPTLEDCSMVFNKENAYTFYGYIVDLKKNMRNQQKTELEKYADIKVGSFSISDISQGKGNYAGGMKNIVNKLQPNVVFYNITLLREIGNTSGISYEYWVKIEGRWVFFPKPWRIFSS